MSLQKNVSELLEAGVIDRETADQIQAYFQAKKAKSGNRLFLVFGILGAILVGLGLILVIAHNWDELPKVAKTLLAFLPLVLGQGLCGYTLLKRKDSVAWRESTTAFLFLAVGACISLISQIYNFPGRVDSFLLTWMLLGLPLVYAMRSSVTSLMYVIGISWYACESGYGSNWNGALLEPNYYWGLLLLVLPHYGQLVRRHPGSNFVTAHNWLIALSLIVCLGIVTQEEVEIMFVAYFSLFGLLFLVGDLDTFRSPRRWTHAFQILGSAGTVILLLILSFDDFWRFLPQRMSSLGQVLSGPEVYVAAGLTLLSGGLLYRHVRQRGWQQMEPIAPVFGLFVLTFGLGIFVPIGEFLIDLYLLVVGVRIIVKGARQDHLGVLNYGLLIIVALAACRFFDAELSFVLRGILFITVGIGFFAANFWMLKKKQAHAQS
ncbi:MAG: DUF2157 domain-containing protein [Bacteroidota bacterium]